MNEQMNLELNLTNIIHHLPHQVVQVDLVSVHGEVHYDLKAKICAV